MTTKVEEAMTDYWGERCFGYSADCPTCQAWGEYDDAIGETEIEDPNPYPDTVSDLLWKKASTKEREWLRQHIRQHEEQRKLLKKTAIPLGYGSWVIPHKR